MNTEAAAVWGSIAYARSRTRVAGASARGHESAHVAGYSWPPACTLHRSARCINDSRGPDKIVRSLADMIGFCMKMIAAAYEDGNTPRGCGHLEAAAINDSAPPRVRHGSAPCGYGLLILAAKDG